MLRREGRSVRQVGGGTGARVADAHLLGHQTAEGDRDARLDLGARAREALLGVAVGEQPQRRPALDDREHLEPAVLPDEVGDRRVTRLVGGDGLAILLGVDDRLLQADLLGELRLEHVVEIHVAPAFAQRDQQPLIEEVLDHHGRVAERLVGDALAHRAIVELLVVALAVEEVVDQVEPPLLRRHVEVEAAVEPARPHERRVERVAAVRRGDQQDVVVLGLDRGELPVARQVRVDPADHASPQPLAQRRLIERLKLDQELVHHRAAVTPAHERLGGPAPCPRRRASPC